MNSLKLLAIAALVVGVQAFAKEAREEAVYVDDKPALEMCDKLPAPMLEKVSSQCDVCEQAPGACIKRTRIERYTDVYRIPPYYNKQCVTCDENGCRQGDCRPLHCPCEPKCAPKCCPEKCCPRVRCCPRTNCCR